MNSALSFKEDSSLSFIKKNRVKKKKVKKPKMQTFEFFVWHNGNTDKRRWFKVFQLKTSKNWCRRKALNLINYYSLVTGCQCYCVV